MRTIFKSVLALVIVTVPCCLWAQTSIVMDNVDADLEGNWQTATSSADRYDKDYKFSSTIPDSRSTASATYTPDIKQAGKYSIDLWYPRGENRATNAPWVIVFDGGRETVLVNQKREGGQWVRIAKEKPFRAGKDGYVQVINNTGSAGSVVVADAVRFVPEGAKDSATAIAGISAPKPATSNKPGSRNNFSLTINASNGRVMKVPDDISYEPNTVVKLTPKADEGYVFNGWTGDTGTTNNTFRNPLSVQMTSDKNITCHFVAAGIGVIMDNDDEGVKKEGPWASSSGNWFGKKYQTYLVATAKAKADSKVTFTPNLPRGGKYDVYVWHPAGKNRTSAAPWTVSSKDGTAAVTINQQVANGEWVALAKGLTMDAGSKPNQYAQVANNTPDFNEPSQDGGRVVIADAVAFVYVGE